MDGQLLAAAPSPSGFYSALSPFLIGGGVALLILSLNYVFAYASGWRDLAKSYLADTRPTDGIWFLTTNNPPFLGMNSEQGVDALLTPRGIYLTARIMRRPFHPPLLLSWPHFESMAVESELFTQVVTLEFADPTEHRIRFSLPKAAISVIREMSGRNDFSGEVLR